MPLRRYYCAVSIADCNGMENGLKRKWLTATTDWQLQDRSAMVLGSTYYIIQLAAPCNRAWGKVYIKRNVTCAQCPSFLDRRRRLALHPYSHEQSVPAVHICNIQNCPVGKHNTQRMSNVDRQLWKLYKSFQSCQNRQKLWQLLSIQNLSGICINHRSTNNSFKLGSTHRVQTVWWNLWQHAI